MVFSISRSRSSGTLPSGALFVSVQNFRLRERKNHMTFSRPIYCLVGPWKQSQIKMLSFETSTWLTTVWHITNCWKMTSVDWTACKNRKTSGKLLSRWHKRSANYLQTIRKWIIDRTDGWAGLALEQVPLRDLWVCQSHVGNNLQMRHDHSGRPPIFEIIRTTQLYTKSLP